MKYYRILLLSALIVTSCVAPKEISYFQDVTSGSESAIKHPDEIRIKPADKLSIIVNSRDYQLTNLFNLPYITQRLGSSSETSLGYSQGVSCYTVDSDGEIDFPVIGRIRIAGMTRTEVCKHISSLLSGRNLVQDAVVTVDYVNLSVSVMGEVVRPGKYLIDKDSYTIIDALSAAGDLQIFAKRNSIKVLRAENGVKKTYSVNICSADELFASPVYFLQQNDIVYVEPNMMRARQSTVNGNNVLSASFWISVASLASSIVTSVSLLISRSR